MIMMVDGNNVKGRYHMIDRAASAALLYFVDVEKNMRCRLFCTICELQSYPSKG